MYSNYKFENQVYIRFPQEIADQINKCIDSENPEQLDIQLRGRDVVKKDNQHALEIDFQIMDKTMKGSLIDLPCISESYRSNDMINLFKSSDISQMIYIHKDDEKDVPELLAKKIVVEQVPSSQSGGSSSEIKKVIKYKGYHGITPPTEFIVQRYYKEKSVNNKEKISEQEKKLDKILRKI